MHKKISCSYLPQKRKGPLTHQINLDNERDACVLCVHALWLS